LAEQPAGARRDGVVVIEKDGAAPREGGPLQKTTTIGFPRSTSEIASSTGVVISAVTIVIGGPPTAKGRPRMTRRGFVYTPAKTRRYEAHGRLAAQQVMDRRPPITVPVRAEITVDLPVPASWSGKRRDAALRGDIRPTTRPDCDNYVKAALDAINAIVVTDDALIVELAAIKRYAAVPALTIVITPLPALTAQGQSRASSAGAGKGEAQPPITLRKIEGLNHVRSNSKRRA
jgi:Holliday junction resolvase RusA-like endonuclease